MEKQDYSQERSPDKEGGKVDIKEQEEALESIAEVLDFLKGRHRKLYLVPSEAEKEE